MPPPCSTVEMLASVRSMVGYDVEFFSGMRSPLRNGCGEGSSGGASSMCWLPSRLV